MILYTTLPRELIFDYHENQPLNTEETILYNGIPLLVNKTNQQEFQVIRVLSTNPQHFLDPRCTPGSIISLS